MALGDDNKNGNKGNYENEFFSPTKLVNYNEKMSIGFSFWKRMLKITISKINEGDSSDKYDKLAYVHLTPDKASMLLEALKKARETPDVTFGVDSGMSETKNVSAFTNTDKGMIFTIAKVDLNGKITDQFDYLFDKESAYTLSWKDFQSMDFERTPLPENEIDRFALVLEQFVVSMTGAVPYGVCDMNRFDNSRINTKLNKICEKMGIEFKGGKGGYSSSNSYFSRNGGGAKSESTTMDDIDDMLD